MISHQTRNLCSNILNFQSCNFINSTTKLSS
jgi:hypothetical protein